MMNKIQVVFDLPKDVLEGLLNGKYERAGGVIVDAKTKRVKAWLEESIEREKNTIDNELPRLPSSLANSQQLMMGLQVANIAVSVVGFAVIYHKLQGIEHTLNNIEEKIDRIGVSQDYLHEKELIGKIAPVLSAVKSIMHSSSFNDVEIAKEKLLHADNTLGEANEYFRARLGSMLVKQLETEYPEEFSACYRAWVMANQGRVNTMLALNEEKEAIQRLEVFKQEHAYLGKEYKAVRSDPIRRIQAGSNALKTDLALNLLGQQMVGVHEIIRGNELQIKYMANNNIQIPQFSRRENNENSDYVIYLVDEFADRGG